MLLKPVLLFAGKGGVGKTTLAAAHALRSAETGTRTLLVSTDPAHSTSDILGATLGPDPVEVEDGCVAVELDPDAEAARYVDEVRHRLAGVTPPGMQAEVDRQLALARETPGVAEAALLERLAALAERLGADWDRMVVDTAPFGHTLRLLAMPEAMRTWVETVIGRRRRLGALERMWRTVRGEAPDADPLLSALERRRERLTRLRATLTDPARCAVVLVAIPERLSVLETARSAQALEASGFTPAGLFINRVTPEDAEGAWAASRRTQEAEHIAALRQALPGLRSTVVAQLPHDVRDRDTVRYIGARLEASS